MLPADFSLQHAIAIAMLFACWFAYSIVLNTVARGSLNSQLTDVRLHWIAAITRRDIKPFDAILLGHIINSTAFFGSATLLVLAGVMTTFVSIKSIHLTMSELHFIANTSLELFALQIGLLSIILGICFFSFTYALRKLIYLLPLIGALPDGNDHLTAHDEMIDGAATVLTEATQTFNFGIRGYYYAVAAIGLFVSPYACMCATAIATAVLFYRQLFTPTARAIQKYVTATNTVNASVSAKKSSISATDGNPSQS